MSIMSLVSYSEARPLAYKALNYRSTRQDLIASNIANVDTPFYKPKDIRFEEVLAKEAKQVLGNEKKQELELAKTSGMHMKRFDSFDNAKPTIFYRDGHLARNDGNSVDLDVETSELSKNGVMYNALISGLKKHGGIFKYALQSSKSL